MDLLIEPLRNQFLGLFFRFCYFFLFLPNFPFLCYFIYFYYLLLLLFSLLFHFFSLSIFAILTLLWSLLLTILFWAPYHLYLSYSPVDFKIVMSQLQHFQNYTLLLFFNHVNFCFLSISLVINIHFYHMLNRFLLVKGIIYISYIYWSSIFFNLNLCFLTNSELITNLVILLSNNISIVTPFCISILSSKDQTSLIFTITFLNISLLSRLQ